MVIISRREHHACVPTAFPSRQLPPLLDEKVVEMPVISRRSPRWLSAWGIGGDRRFLIAGVLLIFGVEAHVDCIRVEEGAVQR